MVNQLFSKYFRQLLLSPKYYASILIWPLLGALLCGVLWAYTNSKLEAEVRAEQAQAMEEAAARADAYAAQLLRTIEHIDHITLSLKYTWETGDKNIDLKKQQAIGLFPNDSAIYATVMDQWGDVVSTTFKYQGQPNFADFASFQAHRAGHIQGLIIEKPSSDLRINKPVIRFSRRLENEDGLFDGVVSVSADPSYLTTFRDDQNLMGGDFISLRFTDGELLAAKAEVVTGKIYRQNPIFPQQNGAWYEPASKFRDSQARIVSWKKIEGYPLVAIAAISEKNAFAAYWRNVKSVKQTALAATVIIALFSIIAMYFSIRQARRKEQAEEVKTVFRIATDAANEGFYMVRPVYAVDGTVVDFRFEDCNERGANLIGKNKESTIGYTLSQILPASYLEEALNVYRQAMEKGFYEDELRLPSSSPVKATWIYRRLVRSGDGLAITLRDISQAKAHEQALSSLANTDALTKLPNRHWLSTFLPKKIEQASAGKKHFAVLFIDLDNFKNINDTLGHDAGDELLKTAASRLKSTVRASDHVVRLGGDEFTVVLDQMDVIDDVSRVAKMIVKGMTEPFDLLGSTGHRVNASIGISLFPDDGQDGETLLKHADIAMYAAKAAGKGCFQFYQAHLSDNLILKLSKEHALRQAVENDEFIMHYQPRVDARSGQLISMEALIRWAAPGRGLIYPHEFIDMAEDTGMILTIGDQVIEKVCTQIAAWKKQGLPLVPVSINVTANQLKAGNFYGSLASCISKNHISPSLIEIELTESCVLEKSQLVTHQLDRLRALGVSLMIDDFGTGYSSLAQLHRLDVDVLKVDPTFTAEVGTGGDGEMIFKAIVSMAKALNISIVAEGVETQKQLESLQALACPQLQGNLISPPVPASEVPALFSRRMLFHVMPAGERMRA